MKLLMHSSKIFAVIICFVILGLQLCSAQLQPILMNTLFTPFSNSEMAAYEDRLVVASDEHVTIYQVSNNGQVTTIDQLPLSSVLYLTTCRHHLIIVKTINGIDCQIYTYNLNTFELEDSLEYQELVPEFATCNESYCFISDLFSGLYVFEIDSDGSIIVEDQYPEIYFYSDGKASCNSDYLLSTHNGMSLSFTIVDVADIHDIHVLPTCDLLDETYQAGLTSDYLVLAGRNPGQNIAKLSQYENNECLDLSTISVWSNTIGAIHSNNNLVVIQGSPPPSYQGRLQVCKITNQLMLHHECNISVPIIDNYMICNKFLYVRDVSNNDLYIYGLFGPPDLHLNRLPDYSIRLSWNQVPGANYYRVYTTTTFDGVDQLIAETNELELIMPFSTNSALYRVTAVR